MQSWATLSLSERRERESGPLTHSPAQKQRERKTERGTAGRRQEGHSRGARAHLRLPAASVQGVSHCSVGCCCCCCGRSHCQSVRPLSVRSPLLTQQQPQQLNMSHTHTLTHTGEERRGAGDVGIRHLRMLMMLSCPSLTLPLSLSLSLVWLCPPVLSCPVLCLPACVYIYIYQVRICSPI